jgi:hypothetical protein
MAVCILVKSWCIYALKTFDVNKTRGRIFSCVRPFYERAVSDLDP